MANTVPIKLKYIAVGLLTFAIIGFGSYGVYLALNYLSQFASYTLIFGFFGLAALLLIANLVGGAVIEASKLDKEAGGENQQS